MKNSIKITFLALAIAFTAASCDSKKATNGSDTTKTDSAAIAVDTTKADTTAAPVDTTKKDTVKK